MSKKPIFRRYAIVISMTFLLGLFILPSIGFGSIGTNSPPAGKNLVKARLPHGSTAAKVAKPILKVHIIQKGDTLVDVLENAGTSKKDALVLAKKADRVFKLKKMRPGSCLELFFTPDKTGLRELDYKISDTRRVVLYNGKVISVIRKDKGKAEMQTCRNRSDRSGNRKRSLSDGKKDVATKNGLPKLHLSASKKTDRQISTHAETSRVVKNQVDNDLSGSLDSFLRTNRVPVGMELSGQRSRTPDGLPGGMKLVSYDQYALPAVSLYPTMTPAELLSGGIVFSPIMVPWEISHAVKATHAKQGRNRLISGVSSKYHPAGKKNKYRNTKYNLARKGHHHQRRDPFNDTFLRVPLQYKRVSSGFSGNRMNPITNLARPHLGIDYAASTGTPVHSIGHGKVIFNGWNGGYGKTVRIQHPNGFISQYAHLSRYGRGISTGKRVRRGEVIGYVGMTGLATGPHLDFRVTRQGRYINPVNLGYHPSKFSSKRRADRARSNSRG